MEETPFFFHQLESPAPDERVAGPIVWLRGWLVGKARLGFVDVRAVCSNGIHLGILGLPRKDLAEYFNSPQPWLPAEYVIGVPLPNGSADLAVEAMDEFGNWHRLQSLKLIVSPDAIALTRTNGEVIVHTGGSSITRSPHLPFHGHLDDPRASTRDSQIRLFGWLLHEAQPVRRIFASLDARIFNVLSSGITDDSLGERIPDLPAARHARLNGAVDAPPTLFNPTSLRVYAELDDGSVHLCFARRLNLLEETPEVAKVPIRALPAKGKLLPALPSGRPRRLLMIVRSLQPDDATLRALDVARHLIRSTQWAIRLIASEDGPLHAEFEAAECPVQIVNPTAFFAAHGPAEAENALTDLDHSIWLRHLDGMAVFDSGSTWAIALARKHGLPVFTDPDESVAWFASSPDFISDNDGDLVAPIRGLAAQGAGVLLHAAGNLSRRPGNRPILVTDVRDTPVEDLFAASIALQPHLMLAAAKPPRAVAAMICPAFRGHPHRALLSALATGVPVITTLSPLLDESFGVNELTLVPGGNPLALANAITDLLANPAARDRRAVAAARIAQETHSPLLQLPRWRAMMESAFKA